MENSNDLNGGYSVNNIESGEWLTFTTEVDVTGDYYLSTRVSSTIDIASISFLFDDVNVTNTVTIPNTGGAWQTMIITVPVSLTARIQELNYLEVIAVPDECISIADWTKSTIYLANNQVVYNGLRYEAKFYTTTNPTNNDT